MRKIYHNYKFLTFCLLALVLWSCSPKDEPIPADSKPLIILDTDIGSSTDDLCYQKPGDAEWAQQILDKIRALAEWRPKQD